MNGFELFLHDSKGYGSPNRYLEPPCYKSSATPLHFILTTMKMGCLRACCLLSAFVIISFATTLDLMLVSS